MELFQLRYFEAVATQGSLTAAAELCHVSQPSLSAQIKSLENELGVKLLNRTPRGVSPTKAGERLLASARKILAEAADVQRDLRQRRFGDQPIFRIAALPFLAADVLPPALAGLLASGAAGEVQVRERTVATLFESVLAEEVDVGLLTLPGAIPEGLERRVLFTSRYAAYCRPDHEAAEVGQLSLREASAHPLLLFHDVLNLAERITLLAEQEKRDIRIVFTSDQAPSVVAMAAEGAGLAILPELLSSQAARRGLQHLPLTDDNLTVSVGAVWRKASTPFAGLEAFLERIAQSSGATPAGRPDDRRQLEEFVARTVESVDELEVLLLLFADPQRTWTAEDVQSRIRSSTASAAKSLASLTAAGLLEHTEGAAYRYRPASPVLDEDTRALAAMYNERRSTVVEMIHSRPSQRVLGFAEAFKLRKKP